MAVHEQSTHPSPGSIAAPLLGLFAPERCRQIYTALRLPAAAGTTVIGVTSTIRGEGRTILALSLAHTLAIDLELPVCLVEADFERPVIAQALGIAPAPGLCEVLRGEHPLAAVTQRVGRAGVVTAGAAGSEAARLLLRLSRDDPFHRPDSAGGLVILDLPPLTGGIYGTLAAQMADAVILLVRAGWAPAHLIRAAVARLDRPPRGIVFNAARSAIPGRRRG